MDKTIKIYTYNGKKGEYKITHINGKACFVVIKDENRGKFTQRVNINKKVGYTLYQGEYDHINDLVII